jgi:hypothetical protein
MKTILKLVVVAAVLHATWRVGSAYWDHYQFEDQVREIAQFSKNASAADLSARVLTLAEQMHIPLQAEELTVTREERHVKVDAAYVREIEFLPRFARPWDFSFHLDVLTL